MTELTACFLQFLSAIYTEAGSSQLDANTLGIITVLVTFALCMIAISNIIGIEKICDNMLIIDKTQRDSSVLLHVYTYT
jgi:hypothetical protein